MFSYLFPKYKLKLILPLSILFLLVFVSVLFSKFTAFSNWIGSEISNTISEMLNAYFPGVGNTALVFGIKKNGLEKFFSLLGDIYNTIPFRGSLFGYDVSSLKQFFLDQGNIGGQIVPCISGSAFYLGNFLAPVVPLAYTVISFKLFRKAVKFSDFYKRFIYIYLSFVFSLVPNMYTHISGLNFFFNFYIPVSLIGIFILNKHGYSLNKGYHYNKGVRN